MEIHVKSNSIINSLKRLDRIGSEDSDTIQKIKDSAAEVSRYLAEHGLINRLPGYSMYGLVLQNESGTAIDAGMSRETALSFARDIYRSRISEVVIEKRDRDGQQLFRD